MSFDNAAMEFVQSLARGVIELVPYRLCRPASLDAACQALGP